MTNQQDLIERAGARASRRRARQPPQRPGLEFVVQGRAWRRTSGTPSGKRYLDYLLGSGPMLLGHAHPAVVEAVQRQLPHGTTFMLLNEPIIELAEEIVRAVPCAEQVRFTSSGSRGDVLRAARGARLPAAATRS